MRRAFGKTIVKLRAKDPNIILMSGDVEQEMDEFKKLYPESYYNMGLCEQSWVTMAAAMALEGLRPVLYTITPFLIERAFEQIKLDIDDQKLPVMLIGNSDYPTHGTSHQCLNAKGLVSLFKNVVGFFPHNQLETEKAMIDCYLMKTPGIISLMREGLPFF